MTYNEQLSNLTSNHEEFTELYNCENLYILLARFGDDNDCPDFRSLEFYEAVWPLRGNHNCTKYKLSNAQNNVHDYNCGWVFSVENNNVSMFEQKAFLLGLETGYQFTKINILDQKTKKQNEHHNKLFEV